MLIYIFRSCAPSVMVVVAETKIWNKKLQKIVDVSHFWMVNPHGECLLLFSTAFWPLCDGWILNVGSGSNKNGYGPNFIKIHQNSWTPKKMVHFLYETVTNRVVPSVLHFWPLVALYWGSNKLWISQGRRSGKNKKGLLLGWQCWVRITFWKSVVQ